MKVSVAILTALAVLMLATGAVQAYTVTHSTLGTLFSDDMEGPYFQAEVGSWGQLNDGTNLLAFTRMKTGATSGGPSAAAVGSDYLEVSRDLTATRMQEAILIQPVSSGTLDIECRYWVNNPWPQIVALDNAIGTSPGFGIAGITNSATLSQPNWHDYANSTTTGAPISTAQWNLFQMHVDLDANNYQITVTPSSTGVPVVGNVVNTMDGTIGRVGIQFHDTAKKFYMDAAPGAAAGAPPEGLACSADTYIQNNTPDTNYGTGDGIYVKSWGGGPNRKAYLKWDISSLTDPVATARMEVQKLWDSASIENSMEVYVLNDGDVGEGWAETGITWNNAPGNVTTSGQAVDPTRTTYLGQMLLQPGGVDDPTRAGDIVTLSSQALIDAINADTDGSLTLLCAITDEEGTGMSFGSKEDTNGNGNYWTPAFAAPRLITEPVPEPGTLCLLGFGLLTLIVVSRRRSR